MRRYALPLALTLAALATPGVARADGAAAIASATELRVTPPEVHLEDARDAVGLVVQASLADGTTRDVTAAAELAVADAAVARVESRRLVPAADGDTTLRVAWGGREAAVPVAVSGAERPRRPSFANDVVPVLTRAGCNAGSCHGASRGKDGFHLSLFGYDPLGDYERITREQAGRRINRAAPEESLLLRKATGAVRHTGGQRFPQDGALYRTVRAWLEAGAPRDPPDLPSLEEVELAPARSVLPRGGPGQRLHVRARYTDGSDRDVTGLAAFGTTDASVATVTSRGVAVPDRRGEAWITARYGEQVVRCQVLVVPDEPGFAYPEDPEHWIDRLVAEKLRRLRVRPSRLCDDATFLRRATLDITGQLPTPATVEAFLASDAPQKRAEAVDRLLERKEFVELWTMKWAERLMIRSSKRVSEKAALRYSEWLEERIAGEVPVDTMVRELLTAEGGTFDTPQVNFFQAEKDGKKLAENVAQAFLGIRLQCAQCHDHPFDRWTQDDYYGFAAFFARVGRKRGADPRERIVFERGRGEVKHPVGGETVAPRVLGGPAPETGRRDRREVLAEWLTAEDNPWFARNLANRIWAHFLGVGIVHEPDDVRVSNPPSNPALLDALAERLRSSDYDVKALVRAICTSRTYQRSTETNASNAHDTRNYAHARVRRLRAEVLLDALAQATGAPNDFEGLPEGARAVQIADGATSTYFLTTFGRATRESVCACEVRTSPNLSQALHLLNGAAVHDKVREGGVVPRLLEDGLAPLEVAERLYLRSLARPPSDAERDALRERLAATEDARAALEDLFWALLNSREFLFNH